MSTLAADLAMLARLTPRIAATECLCPAPSGERTPEWDAARAACPAHGEEATR